MRADLPSIIKASEGLLELIERADPSFPRKHRYTLGKDIRAAATDGAVRAHCAMVSKGEAHLAHLRRLVALNDQLKIQLQMAHRLQCFRSAGQFEDIARQARDVGRQAGALLKARQHPHGQNAGASAPPAASRAAEYLALADAVPGPLTAVNCRSPKHAASIAIDNTPGTEFVLVSGGDDTWEGADQRDACATFFAAARNESPKIIRDYQQREAELVAECERLRGECADLRWLAIAVEADHNEPAHRREYARKLLPPATPQPGDGHNGQDQPQNRLEESRE